MSAEPPQTEVEVAQGIIGSYLTHHDPDALVCNATADVLREMVKLLMAPAAAPDPEMVATRCECDDYLTNAIDRTAYWVDDLDAPADPEMVAVTLPRQVAAWWAEREFDDFRHSMDAATGHACAAALGQEGDPT